MMPAVRHHHLSLLAATFDSPLVDAITERGHPQPVRSEGSARGIAAVGIVLGARELHQRAVEARDDERDHP